MSPGEALRGKIVCTICGGEVPSRVGSAGARIAVPVKISVGPPVLTINQGSTFMVTDLNGEVGADSELGVFADDTRFVSYYAIFASGERGPA